MAVERTPDGLRPEMLGKLFENANYLLLRPSLAKRDPIVVASLRRLSHSWKTPGVGSAVMWLFSADMFPMAEFLKVLLRRSLVSGGIPWLESLNTKMPSTQRLLQLWVKKIVWCHLCRRFLPNSNKQARLEKSIFTNLQIFYFQHTSLFVSPYFRIWPPWKRFILEML